MASPDGYSWQNGEVVTATKLNEGALPPLGPENQQVMFGQDATHSLVLKWNYNATAANAFALITTFGQNNDLYLQAKNFYFDTPSLAFAVQMFDNGRVRVGGGSDDAANAFQVNGSSSAVASLIGRSATAIPAGGTTGAAALLMSSTTGFGIYFGSGAPTLIAAKGSLYLRSDGTTTGDRIYVNSDGVGSWVGLNSTG